MFKGLIKKAATKLEFEVVSDAARSRLTRLLRNSTAHNDGEIEIAWQNRAINISRTTQGLPIYVLSDDGWGGYHPAEYAWHYGELELALRRPTTLQLVEVLGDLLQMAILACDDVNEVLDDENASFRFAQNDDGDVAVKVLKVEEIPEDKADEHPSVRILVSRMEQALKSDDPAGVLHASASVFESLAKIVVNISSVENQTLASFFARYRKDSKLPGPILDYMLEIYKRRNIEPLAGHGSTSLPIITPEEALMLAEMTKAFVRAERRLGEYAMKASAVKPPLTSKTT